MHASCESPWHPIAKRCVLDTCFLLTSPFRGMLLTPRGGPRCLAPTAHRVPVYPMVSITFLCHACTAQPIPPLDPYVRLSPHTAHERGILRERSISPAPRCIPHGQLCAFAGYLCTVSLPSPSGPSPSVLILVYPAFLGADYYALFDCLLGLGVSFGSPHSYSP